MKKGLTMTMAMAMMLETGLAKAAEEKTVIVYLENHIAPAEEFIAKNIASKMFESAGVRILWRSGSPSDAAMAAEQPIVIRFGFRTSPLDRPGSLAYALPYEGVHITVFYDRVRSDSTKRTRAILAHVMVHEITHILQGVARHSETGVMKPKYSEKDFLEMTWRPFSFTSTDVDLIQTGLSSRTGLAMAAKR